MAQRDIGWPRGIDSLRLGGGFVVAVVLAVTRLWALLAVWLVVNAVFIVIRALAAGRLVKPVDAVIGVWDRVAASAMRRQNTPRH